MGFSLLIWWWWIFIKVSGIARGPLTSDNICPPWNLMWTSWSPNVVVDVHSLKDIKNCILGYRLSEKFRPFAWIEPRRPMTFLKSIGYNCKMNLNATFAFIWRPQGHNDLRFDWCWIFSDLSHLWKSVPIILFPSIDRNSTCRQSFRILPVDPKRMLDCPL